jgi:hypothetical protein
MNQMIVRVTDQESLFREASTIAVEVGKFKMSWFGLSNEETKNVEPVMVAGEKRLSYQYQNHLDSEIA